MYLLNECLPSTSFQIVLTSGGEYHGTVRLKLDEKEVRTLAGKIQGHTAVEYSVAMFIGLVRCVTFFTIYRSSIVQKLRDALALALIFRM